MLSPSSSKKADIALTFFNWAYSEEGAIAKGYGIEGETYEIVDGKPQMLPAVMDEIIKSGTNSPKYELMSRFGLGVLDFTPYVDIGSDEGVARYQQSPEDLERLLATVEMCNNDKGLQIAPYAPALTAEQQERSRSCAPRKQTTSCRSFVKFIRPGPHRQLRRRHRPGPHLGAHGDGGNLQRRGRSYNISVNAYQKRTVQCELSAFVCRKSPYA
jgi:hypothetical protein